MCGPTIIYNPHIRTHRIFIWRDRYYSRLTPIVITRFMSPQIANINHISIYISEFFVITLSDFKTSTWKMTSIHIIFYFFRPANSLKRTIICNSRRITTIQASHYKPISSRRKYINISCVPFSFPLCPFCRAKNP